MVVWTSSGPRVRIHAMAKTAPARAKSSARGPRNNSSAGGRARGRKRRDEEVLDAAARVFARRGYSDASVQDVADELGILKGSLYHYISTKEDLLFWLLEGVQADFDAVLAEVSDTEGLSPVDQLALYVRSHVAYNLD